MKYRLATIIIFPTLMIWLSPSIESWQIYLLVSLVGLIAFWAFPLASVSNPPQVFEDEKIVSLDAFRHQKQNQPQENTEIKPQFETVYEAQFIYEADMMAAMLEQNGIEAHVLNRNIASILVHPLGEMKVKVMVPYSFQNQALALIEKHLSGSFPEDTSIA